MRVGFGLRGVGEPDETGPTAEIKSVNGGPLPMYNVELMLMFRVRETGRDGVIVLDIEERQHVDIGTVGPTAGQSHIASPPSR
jgi:hypothetical protein